MGETTVRTDIPHSARIYDYLLGGKDNFKVDRDAADEAVKMSPTLPGSMRANRNFMVRAARYLARDLGLRQFLDIGTGLPTSPNMHEVVHQAAPDARVVYVDNDPIVLVHARARLTSTPHGRTAYVDADLREPRTIFAAPELAILDLSKPVALTLIAVVHLVLDENEARRIIRELLEPLPSGSALALSAVTVDGSPDDVDGAVNSFKARGLAVKPRTSAEVEVLFADLDLVDPGVVPVHRWHPEDQSQIMDDNQVHMYGGVGVKR